MSSPAFNPDIAGIRQLSPPELLALLQAESELSSSVLQLLDVRTPEEYSYLGHIPGARLIPLHELPARLGELDKACKTVLICEHGVRSMDASYYLKAHLGFNDISNLTTGMADWPYQRLQGQEQGTLQAFKDSV